MVNFSFPLANRNAILHKIQWKKKTLSKNAYVLCECMYLDVCMGKACITLFLSTICITIGLLRAGNLLKVLSAFSWEPQKHLRWLGVRTDSVRWEDWEREKCRKGSIASRWYCWAVVMNPSAFKACVCSSSSYHVLQREFSQGTKTLWFHGNHGWLRLSMSTAAFYSADFNSFSQNYNQEPQCPWCSSAVGHSVMGLGWG